MTFVSHIPKKVARIIYASLFKIATLEQEAELAEWLEMSEANRNFYELVKAEPYRLQQLQEFARYDSRRDWKKVKVALDRRRSIRIRRLWVYAAIFILALGTGGVFLYLNMNVSRVVSGMMPLEPGRYQAKLILPGGKVIPLGASGQSDTLLLFSAGNRVRNDGHRLTYESEEGEITTSTHVLQVPRGGEYRLLLADGTRVWLNAESELHYPDHFVGNNRQVMLTGEAYFEVAKDTCHPFYVQAGGMEVKVLGTSFNISAYRGESAHTTLVEGKVTVSAGTQRLEIKPGEQALMEHDSLKIRRVNVENYIGWKSQRFVYEDKLLVEVLHDLERWYDVRITLADPLIGQLHLTANLPKYARMDQVLEIISYAACVKFEVTDRQVIVRMDR